MSIPAKLDTWDYVSLSVVIALSTLVAFYHVFNIKKNKKNTKEFLVSGKDVGFFPIILSTVATAISPISMQGFPTEIYTNGINFILISVSPIMVMPIFAYLYLPVYYNLGISSIFQYLEFRFNRSLMLMASVINTAQLVFYTSCVLYAPSLALNQVTGLGLWSSVLSIGIVCIVYTAMGGIKAVIWADVIQLLVMFVAILVVLIKGCIDVGGVATVWQRALEGDRLNFHLVSSAETKDTIWTFLIGHSIGFLGYMCVSQMLIQRFLSNPSVEKAKWSLYLSVIVMTIMVAIFSMTGYIIYARYYDCDPLLSGIVTSRDQYVPLFAVETLSFIRGFSGIYVAGVLCASLSTLSSVLNALSAITLSDYIKPLYSSLSDTREKFLAKILAVAYGALCIAFVALAANMGGVVRAVFIISGATGGPLFTVFTLGVLFPWVTARGATIGFLASLTLGLWAAVGSLLSDSHIPTAPLSVEGCNISAVSNMTDFAVSTVHSLLSTNYTESSVAQQPITAFSPPTEFFLYTISPLWYTVLAAGFGIVVGIFASVILGVQDPEEIDPRLISPPAEKLFRSLPEKLRLHLGYKTDKLKLRNFEKKMEYQNGKESKEVKIPLQSTNKEDN